MEGAGIEKSVFDVTEDIPSYRPPEEIEKDILNALREAEEAKRKIFEVVKNYSGIEPVEINLEAKTLTFEKTPSFEGKVLVEKGESRKGKVYRINLYTKKGKGLYYTLLDLSRKTTIKGWKYLLPYACFDRFGVYQIVIRQNKVFFIGVYGVREEVLEKDEWKRVKVMIVD